MGKGYITINRKLQKHWLWDDKPFSKGQAWIDMLMRARHTDEKKLVRGELLDRKRGDVCCSLSYLAKEWGWSREKVRRFMAMLESDGMITLHATTHDTTITIENYDKYQFKRTTNEATDEATDLATDEAQRNNDNKCINKGRERDARKSAYGRKGKVLLTDEEYKAIKEHFTDADGLINHVGEYLANASKHYEDHDSLIWQIGKQDKWAVKRQTQTYELTQEEIDRMRTEAFGEGWKQ